MPAVQPPVSPAQTQSRRDERETAAPIPPSPLPSGLSSGHQRDLKDLIELGPDIASLFLNVIRAQRTANRANKEIEAHDKKKQHLLNVASEANGQLGKARAELNEWVGLFE